VKTSTLTQCLKVLYCCMLMLVNSPGSFAFCLVNSYYRQIQTSLPLCIMDYTFHYIFKFWYVKTLKAYRCFLHLYRVHKVLIRWLQTKW
jgi:hypothetical protein